MTPIDNKLIIFYFSGTGNALSASQWMIEEAQAMGLDAMLVPVVNSSDFDFKLIDEKTLVGFTFPTHGFCAPWAMLKFILNFPTCKPFRYFIMNTRAGFKLFNWHGFGFSGMAHWIPMFILKLKGYVNIALKPLDMPHSWISFFPPNPQKACLSIAANCRNQVSSFFKKIIQGKNHYSLNVWLELPLGIALLPVTLGYLLQGRFILAKTLYASSACNNCNICVNNCPVNAIEIKWERPYWKYNCESCMRCMNICPQKAIQSMVTRVGLFFYLVIYLGGILAINSKISIFIIAPLLVFLFYFFVLFIIRNKYINKIFEYTSFTRLWNRYLAPGIKIKNFKHEK